MRTIKFRGMSKKIGGLVYGWGCFTDESERQYIVTDMGGLGFVEITKGTLSQFTGLSDKNGKEIYEGDILGREYRPWFEKPNGKMETATVVYEKDQFVGDNSTGIQYFISNPHPYYVIGNIWENPELLEK